MKPETVEAGSASSGSEGARERATCHYHHKYETASEKGKSMPVRCLVFEAKEPRQLISFVQRTCT